MDDQQKDQEVFRQNLNEKGNFQTLFQIYLLFTHKGSRPDGKDIQKTLLSKFEKVDIVANVKDSLSTFAIWKYIVEYKDNQRLPAQVLMSDFENFDGNNIDLMQRSQLWDCPEKDEILSNCKYKIMLSDFMASGLPYKERCAMLTEWLETTLELFPDCVAVWTPSSGKLLTREQVLNNPWAAPARFLHFGMNIRFFNIQNTNDMIVDTLGLYAIGLPDIQYHFHDLDPNAVVNHAYNAAAYIFDTNASIKDGETIDGISEQGIDRSIQWKCQYERSLIQPDREVMDICPGQYAAGERE